MSEVLFWAAIAGIVLVASLRLAYLVGVNAGLEAAQEIFHDRLEPGHRGDKTAADYERDVQMIHGVLRSRGLNENASPSEFPQEVWEHLYIMVSCDRDRWRNTARNRAGNA